MTKSWKIDGLACLALLMVGCNREQAPPEQQTNRTAVPVPVESVAARTDEPALPVVESPAPESVTTGVAADHDDHEQIAADFKKLADPRIAPEGWEAAQSRILDHGALAVPVLSSGLSSSDPIERETAATMLAMIGEGLEQAEQPLRDALRDDSAYVRANAATALCQLPGTEDAVIPTLAALLQSPDPTLRQIAAVNLGNFGPEAAPFVDSLTGSLDDDRPDVLMPVVELLGRIGPAAEAAAPKLRQIAFEQTGDIRTAATTALGQIESGD